MPVEFPLTPRTLNILRGRGLTKSGDNPREAKLLCSAPICLFETEHKGFGREIEITGYAICPCGTKAIYPDDRFSDDSQRKSYWKCPTCKAIIPEKLVVWTQQVVAKHQGKSKGRQSKGKHHTYHHKECFENMSIGSVDDDEQT
jgi:hypothetical protein